MKVKLKIKNDWLGMDRIVYGHRAEVTEADLSLPYYCYYRYSATVLLER